MDSKQLTDLIGTFTVIGIGVFVALINKWGDYLKEKIKEHKGKLFEKNLEIRKQIDEELLKIMEKMEASRCCFYEFSNGESSLAGLPFQFIRMTYEKTHSSIRPIQKELDKISVNQQIVILSKMNTDDIRYYNYDDTDEEEIRRHYIHYGAKNEIRVKVGKRLQDGMIGIWYHQDFHEPTLEELEYLYQKAYEIKLYLEKLKKAH